MRKTSLPKPSSYLSLLAFTLTGYKQTQIDGFEEFNKLQKEDTNKGNNSYKFKSSSPGSNARYSIRMQNRLLNCQKN